MRVVVIVMAVVLCFGSCASTNTGTGPALLNSAEQLGELRAENAELARRLDTESRIRRDLRDALERAEADATDAVGDLRKAIQLFTEYKRAIDNYFHAISAYEGATGRVDAHSDDAGVGVDSVDSTEVYTHPGGTQIPSAR